MTEAAVVILAALIGAGAVVAGSLIGLVMQQRLLDRQLADRRAERNQERRFEIYRESLLLLMGLADLMEEALISGDAGAARELGNRVQKMRADISVVGGKRVREASDATRDAFQEFVKLSIELRKRNLERPLEQRESTFDIRTRAYNETMTLPVQELAQAMREELGIEE